MIEKVIAYLRDQHKAARDSLERTPEALAETAKAIGVTVDKLREGLRASVADLRDWVDYLEANNIEDAKKRIRDLEGEVAGLESRIRAFKDSTGAAVG